MLSIVGVNKKYSSQKIVDKKPFRIFFVIIKGAWLMYQCIIQEHGGFMRNFILKRGLRLFWSLVVFAVFFMTACSVEEEGPLYPPALSNKSDRTIDIPAQDTEYDFDLIEIIPTVYLSPSATMHDLSAVPFDYFVIEAVTEMQARMHTYQLVSHDGVTSRRDDNIDLYWKDFAKGYLLIDFLRAYFHEYSQKQNYGYNLQFVKEIRMYRTMTVVKPDGEEVLVHVNTLNEYKMNNPQNGHTTDNSFRMQDLITKYITKSPQNYRYFITSADYTGGSTGSAILEWTDMQRSYYSKERDVERIFFPSEPQNMAGTLRLRDVVRVELISK